MGAWDDMDRWCRERCDALTQKSGEYIMRGGNLNAPNYRTNLGKHQAYSAMRSFIHSQKAAWKAAQGRPEWTVTWGDAVIDARMPHTAPPDAQTGKSGHG